VLAAYAERALILVALTNNISPNNGNDAYSKPNAYNALALDDPPITAYAITNNLFNYIKTAYKKDKTL